MQVWDLRAHECVYTISSHRFLLCRCGTYELTSVCTPSLVTAFYCAGVGPTSSRVCDTPFIATAFDCAGVGPTSSRVCVHHPLSPLLTVQVWDLRARKCVYTIPSHRSLISSAHYEHSSGGQYIVTGGYDGLIKVSGILVHRSCCC